MEHGRRRGAQHPRSPHQPIELGNEPPLSVDGETVGVVDRRRVSVQWFSATILTGLCGAALMGGAVFASLDRETSFASLPEPLASAQRSDTAADADQPVIHKSDELPIYSEPSVARQVLHVTTTTRIGNRQIVRVRPFVRIVGTLSLSVSSLSAKIPPFNPQRMLEDSGSATAVPDPASLAAPDAEVSFVTRNLAPMLAHLKLAVTMPASKVLADLRKAANWNGNLAEPPAVGLDGIKLAYASEGTNADPYAGFQARIVPENVTLLPKTTRRTTTSNPWNEQVVTAKNGDSVVSLLQGLGATAADAKAIAARFGARGAKDGLKPGEKLRVLLLPGDNGRRLKPVRVIIAADNRAKAVVALSETGKYVSVDVQNANTIAAQPQHDETDRAAVGLYRSIYETALRDHVPRPVIDDLIHICSYDVDLEQKVEPGDSFEVMYAKADKAIPGEAKPEVIFAALTVNGDTKKFYRFQTPDDGAIDYYDQNGRSAKKFLIRKPVPRGVMTSGFGWRRHPLLGYVRLHTGVDWGAPTGTPVFAAGDGVIEKEGWESGYGKFILIRHHNGYETAYAHMSAYAKGTHVGLHVRQGQIIGFVGSTGLSTGSHLHFEIRINSRFVDPMRIKLPRGRTLTGPILADFEQERARIDTMMARGPVQTAQRAQ